MTNVPPAGVHPWMSAVKVSGVDGSTNTYPLSNYEVETFDMESVQVFVGSRRETPINWNLVEPVVQ